MTDADAKRLTTTHLQRKQASNEAMLADAMTRFKDGAAFDNLPPEMRKLYVEVFESAFLDGAVWGSKFAAGTT